MSELTTNIVIYDQGECEVYNPGHIYRYRRPAEFHGPLDYDVVLEVGEYGEIPARGRNLTSLLTHASLLERTVQQVHANGGNVEHYVAIACYEKEYDARDFAKLEIVAKKSREQWVKDWLVASGDINEFGIDILDNYTEWDKLAEKTLELEGLSCTECGQGVIVWRAI